MAISQILSTGVSGHIYRDVSVGKHRIQVTAQLLSNSQTKKVLKLPHFTIDQPPTIPPTRPPPPHVTAAARIFNNCSARLSFDVNVTATFRCRVNGGPWIDCKISYTS